MAVTFSPVIFSKRPVDEAICEFQPQDCEDMLKHKPMTPFPIPLTTPPETMMYFVMTIEVEGQGREWSVPTPRRVAI